MWTNHKPNDLVTIDRIAAGHDAAGHSRGIIQINPCPRAECSVRVAADGHPGSLGGIGGSGLSGVSTKGIDPGLRAADTLKMGDKINAGRPIRVVEGGPIRERVSTGVVIHQVAFTLGQGQALVCQIIGGQRTVPAADGVAGRPISILPDAVGRIAFGSGEDDISHEGIAGQIVDVGDAGAKWER